MERSAEAAAHSANAATESAAKTSVAAAREESAAVKYWPRRRGRCRYKDIRRCRRRARRRAVPTR